MCCYSNLLYKFFNSFSSFGFHVTTSIFHLYTKHFNAMLLKSLSFVCLEIGNEMNYVVFFSGLHGKFTQTALEFISITDSILWCKCLSRFKRFKNSVLIFFFVYPQNIGTSRVRVKAFEKSLYSFYINLAKYYWRYQPNGYDEHWTVRKRTSNW